jgi:hypothetical protein
LVRNILGSNEALTLFLKTLPFSLFRKGSPPTKGRARPEDYSDYTAQIKMKSRLVRTVGERSEIGEFATPRLRFYSPATPMIV